MTLEENGFVTPEIPHVEIPIEAIIDGEVVVVDTKAIPIIPRKDIGPS